jgi:hypothetical protein
MYPTPLSCGKFELVTREIIMARLIKLSEWIQDAFGSDISIRTAQNWCKNGYIPSARKVGKLWFVDPEAEKETTGIDLVDSILKGNK